MRTLFEGVPLRSPLSPGRRRLGQCPRTPSVDVCPGRPCFSVHDTMKQRHQDLFKCCSSMTHCCTSCSTKSLFLQHKTIAFFACFVPLVTKWLFLQHRTLVIFLGAVFHRFCRTKLSRIFKFTFLMEMDLSFKCLEVWVRVRRRNGY